MKALAVWSSLALLVTLACNRQPSSQSSASGANASSDSILSASDTSRVVDLAKRSLCSGERACWLGVDAYEADTAGVLVTLFGTDSLGQVVPGGGGKVRVTRTGSVQIIERYQ